MRIAGIVALIFGLLTILSGGAALFGGQAAREAAGAVVPFVLWFNFLAGFAYVAAGLGLLKRWRWAAWLSAAIAAATMLTALAFGIHVYLGGAYEVRTAMAMALRAVAWLAIAIFAYRAIILPRKA